MDILEVKFPNLRSMFIPDAGYTIFDIDQAGADAQVVAWDADDQDLKEKFRSGMKIHALNAKDIFGANAGPDGKREPYYTRAKMGVHLTNYGGTARTCATALGISIHEAELFQHRWFQIHPPIKHWHERIKAELNATRTVRNKFGYRRLYFDRTESVLKEALAWIPQSTVACVTNRAWVNLEEANARGELPVEVLLQVHDSLVCQAPTATFEAVLRAIQPLIRIVIPYDDPLIIPWGLKTSTISWGDCDGRSWPT